MTDDVGTGRQDAPAGLQGTRIPDPESSDDVWAEVAEYREELELVVEEDLPFAERARRLLVRLDEEGY